MMGLYDRMIAVDWSARSRPSSVKPTADAIFMCDTGVEQKTTYHRTRMAAFDVLCYKLDCALVCCENTLLGFDFAFGYPAGFAKVLTGTSNAQAVWKWMAAHVTDNASNGNNRFEVAAYVNSLFAGIGPFWGCPSSIEFSALPYKGTARCHHGMAERRLVEKIVPSSHSPWKLYTTGAVGSQTLVGLPYLYKLHQRYGEQIAFWPFNNHSAPITCAEIYPSQHKTDNFLHPEIEDSIYQIKDAVQVQTVCNTFANMSCMSPLIQPVSLLDRHITQEEGWILGVVPESKT